MSTTKVTVSSDEFGNVINISPNNPEYGYVRIEQTVSQINDGGWLRLSKRSALIKGLVNDLVSAKFSAGMQLPGKIIVKESLEPFNPENPDKNLKIAGDTGIICNIGGQPIYRDTFYSPSETAEDILIMHDDSCAEEIKNIKRAENTVKKMSLRNLKQEESVAAFEEGANL